MKIFSKLKLTDAEYVERIRKDLRVSKKWGWGGLIFSGVLFVAYAYLFPLIPDWIEFTKKAAPNSQSFWLGIVTGFLLGFLFGGLLLSLGVYFVKSIILILGSRRDKLLVAYYDQLHSTN
jgi:H+/Cl- antiporter ClcA